MTLITNRRSMLLGLMSATTVAATGSTATGAPAPQESAELLTMADQLESTLQTYLGAVAEKERIVSVWGPQWPTPDPEIIWYGNGSKRHEDILGRGIETPWGKNGAMRVHNIGTPEGFKAAYHDHTQEAERKSKFKSQRGMKTDIEWAKRCKARIKPARDYWSEVERIKAASGIEAAQSAVVGAREALHALVGRIINYEERTIAGLIIKAQAMRAWSEVDQVSRALNVDSLKWADAMSATILRQASST